MSAASTTRISSHAQATRVQSLRPNVTREEAIRELSRSGLAGMLHRAAFGSMQSIADLYIPFRVFRVDIVNNGRAQTSIFGLDAVQGSLDLYHFDAVHQRSQRMHINTRNHLPPALDEARATELVIDKVRRAIFTRGFFRMRQLRISASLLPDLCHIPYWVGFYGRPNHLRFSVLDAVRRRFEGDKVRQLVLTWLYDQQTSSQPKNQQIAIQSKT
jgi:hypothetical protein